MNRKWEKFKQYFENGDCQIHTNYTDGLSTPEEYFEQAEINGLDFILFSEHVRRKTTYDYLKFKEHVYRIGARSKVKFAVGAEAKVLNEEGDLDISNEIAHEAEIILFSFHTPNFPIVESYIRAIYNASQNPLSDVFAHPTFYHNWQNLKISQSEWNEIFKCLIQFNICYEFNKKYPLPDVNEIYALKNNSNLSFVFGSDAHSFENLLSKSDIQNFKKLIF